MGLLCYLRYFSSKIFLLLLMLFKLFFVSFSVLFKLVKGFVFFVVLFELLNSPFVSVSFKFSNELGFSPACCWYCYEWVGLVVGTVMNGLVLLLVLLK